LQGPKSKHVSKVLKTLGLSCLNDITLYVPSSEFPAVTHLMRPSFLRERNNRARRGTTDRRDRFRSSTPVPIAT